MYTRYHLSGTISIMDTLSFIVNAVSIIGMIVVATVIALSSYSKSKLFFVATIYTACIWLFLQYVVQFFSIGGVLGLWFIQLTSVISFVIAFFFYGFSRSYINKPVPSWLYGLLFTFFVIELILNMSGLMIQSAWGDKTGVIIEQSTNLYQIYILSVGLVFIVSLFELVKATLIIKSKKDRAQNRLLIIGILQATIFIFCLSTFFKSSSALQTLVPVSLLAMSIMVGLAIVKYQLFDIRLAVVRTVTYILSLLTLSVVYYYVAYLVSLVFFKGDTSSSVSINPVNIGLALLLAFIFQPIRRFFDRITNKIFYKDNYDINDFFARLNRTLSVTTDLRGLLERVAYEIGHTLKGEQAFFFINTDNGHYITAGTDHHKQLPKFDAMQIGQVHDGNHEVIVASLLEKNDPIRRLMISHRIELILPLIKDDKIIGYLCLGDHLTSSYTKRDIKALYTISDELIIAIQNALAVQEIRELNATLQQKVANATKELRSSNTVLRQLDKVKDEFISMASHQLRTPLTSVKGYISMVIEGDVGKITNPQKKLLNEAFMSSERMVHLINDFLNVSRIQTGKFIIDKSPVDLSKLVSEEIDSLRPNASARGLKFTYKPPKKFPIMELDEGKMRQVVMNFADNAIYYSHENSTIAIKLSVEGDKATFTVKDSGIGVPVGERSQLFSKFYRASNARVRRPDGTGVGIYLAKKVIDALDGKVIFESVEGKGSTFGFSLPILPK